MPISAYRFLYMLTILATNSRLKSRVCVAILINTFIIYLYIKFYIINVDEIHNKLKDKEKELNEYNIENKKLYSRISNNKDTLKHIEKITDKIKDDENNYNVIGELSELANGNNVERITFERYVLAAYFD